MKSLTFRECRKFIEAIKKTVAFSELKGIENTARIKREEFGDKALVIKRGTLDLLTGDGVTGFYFYDDIFEKKGELDLETYYKDDCLLSLFQLDIDLLLDFLEKDRQLSTVLHDEIDFELGFRLRKRYLDDPDTTFVIFYWRQGPILLCSICDDREIFQSSDDILPEDVLTQIKEKWGNQPCGMYLLRKTPAGDDADFSSAFEEDFDEEEFEEEDILVMEMALPSKDSMDKPKIREITTSHPQQKATVEEQDLDEEAEEELRQSREEEIRKSLEESVVIREEELPELGAEDADILDKYGIGVDENGKKIVLDDAASVALDEEIPPMEEKDLEIFKKYGVDLEKAEGATYRDVREKFEDSVILREEELPAIKPEDASVLEKYGIMLKSTQREKPAPCLTAHDVKILQKYGLKLPHGEKSSLNMIGQSFQLAVAVKKLSTDIALKDRPVFAKFGLKLPQRPLLQRIPWHYVAIGLLFLLVLTIVLMIGSWQSKKKHVASCKVKIEKLERYRDNLKQSLDAIVQIEGKYGANVGDLRLDDEKTEKLAQLKDKVREIEEFIAGGKDLLEKEKIKDVRKFLADEEIDRYTGGDWVKKSGQLKDEVLGQLQRCEENFQQMQLCRKNLKSRLAAMNQLGKDLCKKYGSKRFPLNTDPDTAEKWWQLEERLEDLDKAIKRAEKSLKKADFVQASQDLSDELVGKFLRQNLPFQANELYASVKRNIERCENKIEKIEKYKADCLRQGKGLRELLEEVAQKYPTQQGYPEPNPKILKKLNELQLFFEQIDSAVATEKLLLGKANIEGALSFWESPKGRLVLKSDWLKQLKRSSRRVKNTLSTCKAMYKNRSDRSKIRKASRIFSAHINALSQKLKSVLEDLDTLKEKYPANQGFPPFPPEADKLIDTTRGHIAELEEKSRELDKVRFDNVPSALKLADACLAMKEVDLTDLEDMQEILRERISVSEGIAEKKELRRQSLQVIREFEAFVNEMRQELYQIEKGSQKLASFPKELEIPRPDNDAKSFLRAAGTEVQNLQNFLQKGKKMLESDERLDEAAEYLQTLEKAPFESLLLDLKKTKGNISDAISIAKHTEKQDKQGREVAKLLSGNKEKLLRIEGLTTLVETRNRQLHDNYPKKQGYPLANVSSKRFQKAKSLEKKLRKTVVATQRLIEKKQLEDALKLLRKQKKNTKRAGKMIDRMERMAKELESTLSKCERIAGERKHLARIDKRVAKVNSYITELEKELKPLKRDSVEYIKSYSPKDGYPPIPSEAGEVASQSGEIVEQLRKVLSTVKKAAAAKKFEEAYTQLELIKMRKMLNRDMIAKASKYRYQLEDLLVDATAMKANKQKVEEIRALLNELRKREEGLKQLIPKFTSTLENLEKNYPISEGYHGANKNARPTLKECEEELEQLSDVVATGERYFQSGKYKKSIGVMHQFSNKVTPGLSRLPVLQSIERQLQRTLKKNQALAHDSDSLKKKIRLEKERKQRRKNWKKQLPPWYGELQTGIGQYSALFPKIEETIKDQGSHFLYTKSQVSMKELQRIPEKIADLEEMIYEIKQKADIGQMMRERSKIIMTGKQNEELESLSKYLSNHSIDVEVRQDLDLMNATIPKIELAIEQQREKDLKEALKEMFKAFKRIEVKYEDAYRPMHSLLMNLKAAIPK